MTDHSTHPLRTALTDAEVAQSVREAADLIDRLTEENRQLREETKEQGLTIKAKNELITGLSGKVDTLTAQRNQANRATKDEREAYTKLLKLWHEEHDGKLAQKEAYENLLKDYVAGQDRIIILTRDRDVAEAEAIQRGWKP